MFEVVVTLVSVILFFGFFCHWLLYRFILDLPGSARFCGFLTVVLFLFLVLFLFF